MNGCWLGQVDVRVDGRLAGRATGQRPDRLEKAAVLAAALGVRVGPRGQRGHAGELVDHQRVGGDEAALALREGAAAGAGGFPVVLADHRAGARVGEPALRPRPGVLADRALEQIEVLRRIAVHFGEERDVARVREQRQRRAQRPARLRRVQSPARARGRVAGIDDGQRHPVGRLARERGERRAVGLRPVDADHDLHAAVEVCAYTERTAVASAPVRLVNITTAASNGSASPSPSGSKHQCASSQFAPDADVHDQRHAQLRDAGHQRRAARASRARAPPRALRAPARRAPA